MIPRSVTLISIVRKTVRAPLPSSPIIVHALITIVIQLDTLLYTVNPWNDPFNLGAQQQRSAIVPDSLNGMCVTDIKVTLSMLLRDLQGTVQPFYRVLLSHNNMQIELSSQTNNPLFHSTVPLQSCCQTLWCGNSPVTWAAYNATWESNDPVWAAHDFTCSLNYTTARDSPTWTQTMTSPYQWQDYTTCQFTCMSSNASRPGLQTCNSGNIDCRTEYTDPHTDPCCLQLWCNQSEINWPSYKQAFGPKGGFWDSNNFVCSTQGTWPSTPNANWKNDPTIDATCDYTCLISPNLPWTENCHANASTCTTGTAAPVVEDGCSPFPPVPQYGLPSTLCYDKINVPDLSQFLSGSLSGEWDLSIVTSDSSTVVGALQDWELSFNIVNCYARE